MPRRPLSPTTDQRDPDRNDWDSATYGGAHSFVYERVLARFNDAPDRVKFPVSRTR